MSLWNQMVIIMLILKSSVLMMIKVYLVSARNEFIMYSELQYVISLLETCYFSESAIIAYPKQVFLVYILSLLLHFLKMCIVNRYLIPYYISTAIWVKHRVSPLKNLRQYIIADIDVNSGLLSLFWSISELIVFMLCFELVPMGALAGNRVCEFLSSWNDKILHVFINFTTEEETWGLHWFLEVYLWVFIGLSNIF